MSEMDLNDKVVLLTGGAIGLGLAYGKQLLRGGVKHLAILDLVTSIGEESANELNSEFGDGRVIFIPCDVTNDKQFEAAFAETVDKFGGIDIVINNAGVVNEPRWDLMINVNFNAVVRGTYLGLRYMRKDEGGKGGTIVNIASIYGLDPMPHIPVYVGTKHAVVGLSRSFANLFEEKNTGIRVLTLCPGITQTQLVLEASQNISELVEPKTFIAALEKEPLQTVDSVAQAMVQIIRSAKSGTVWVAEGGEPARGVSIPDRFSLKTPTD